MEALKNHRIDALLFNLAFLKYLSNNQIMNLRPIGNPINLGNGYGIVALKKNEELINKINNALLDIENDGSYEKIYQKYFGN